MMSIVKQTGRVKFGTAGVRGIFGQEVSARESVAVCFAVNKLLGRGEFGLGHDNRRSSIILANTAIAAMSWYGSNVSFYGMIPTPVLAFNVKKSGLSAGLSVTASHNPPQYAGIKVLNNEGIEFSLEEERKMEEIMEKSLTSTKTEEDLREFGALIENEEAIEAYKLEMQAKFLAAQKNLRIIVDCGNGTSHEVTPKILSRLGYKVMTVNSHPSPSFPGRISEPTHASLQEVANLVRSLDFDLGIAHDGDADRVVMIDDRGIVVPDYALSSLVLKIILEKGKKGTVVISHNASNALEKIALKAGCNVERCRLGKASEELYKHRGIFATEPSKIVDPNWGFWEDGIYAAILVAQYLSRTNQTLSSVLETIPKYFGFQWNVESQTQSDYGALKRGAEKAFSAHIDRIEEIDGIKVWLKENDAWIMLRRSGTEKKVRLYGESLEMKDASQILEKAIKVVAEAGV